MSNDPDNMLNDARKAVKNNDFPAALEKYEYFFDHALDDDPASFYGVRLSYCLDEWVRLGKKYPKAIDRLESKKDEAILLLKESGDAEKFHDYVSICEYLGKTGDAIEGFIHLHESNQDLAKKVVRFIWKKLVEKRQWKLCSFYLDNPSKNLSNALNKFDESMTICKADPSLGGEDFERQIKGWYVTDIGNVLLVLKYSERFNEFMSFRNEAFENIEKRGYPELVDKIKEKITL
jgi:hypothetical protein